MSGQLVLSEPREVERAAESAILSVIARAASDPTVDVAKMTALLDLQERIMAKQAEIEFNRDFSAASNEMPRIGKRGEIKMVKDGVDKGTIKFAKYEDLDDAIKPVEKKYGFTRSFQTAPSSTAGIEMTMTLSHRGGHSVKSTRHMPPDPGPGRNAMQAIGSAGSYAKRYLTRDGWNIVDESEDDDARATGYIDERQVNTIIDMFNACEMDAKSQSKFLDVAAAKSVSEIRKSAYANLMQMLQTKLRKVQEGK